MIPKIRWPSVFLALLPLLSIPISTQLNALTFSPRGLIHSHQILPLFFAIFASPPDALSAASRLVQSALLLRLPLTSLPTIYAFTFALCVVRSLVGFIFTRSVGWAAPQWFSHYSLYEPLAGLGPGLYAYLTIVDNDLPGYIPPLVAVVFCWMEDAPWTYGLSILMAISIRVILFIANFGLRTWHEPLPGHTTGGGSGDVAEHGEAAYIPLRQSGEEEKTLGSSGGGAKIVIPTSTKYGLLPLLALLPFFFIPATRLPFPETSLEILILSFPRPIEVNLSADIINATVNSFTPYLSAPAVTISAFTHSTNHDALHLVAETHTNLEYHVDTDTHLDDVNGHYLHLAEAFRWAKEERKAKWFMLVEDDFPVCEGGWDVIATTMNMLEERRGRGEVDAGFIGTGGSGIIIHHSYLPLLTLILRQYSTIEPPFPPGTRRRAPDQVIQDCIVGRPGSLCERDHGKAIISSRIVLDHIGGMATTTKGKALNSDKWRCGWRHAFHGDGAVDVVVV